MNSLHPRYSSILLLVFICLAIASSSLIASPHSASVIAQVENESSSAQEDLTQNKDQIEAQRVEAAHEREKGKERRKNWIVYSCFGLSLFILLWMRKRSKGLSEKK